MTNFEKLKSMSQDEFASAISATVGAFELHKERSFIGLPRIMWTFVFADWFRDFIRKEYNGVFEKRGDVPDNISDSLRDILRDILPKEPRHNPFKED